MLINNLIKELYFYWYLCSIKNDEKRKKEKLCFYILKKLEKRYPNILVYNNIAKILNLEFDIYIPNLELAFAFKKVYRNDGYSIKEKIINKIRLCKKYNIRLYVFDIDEIKLPNEKYINYLSDEISLKIRQKYWDLKNVFI